jgi:hypothetical protein
MTNARPYVATVLVRLPGWAVVFRSATMNTMGVDTGRMLTAGMLVGKKCVA